MSLMPEDDFNDEIVEIFVEEVGEVLELIDTNFAIWKDNADADAALKEMRRGFHTLKGSGRMVQAEEIGEVAWSIENMLNRLLDKTLAISPAVYDLISDVRVAVPILVESFESRQAAALSGVNYGLLVERAENILAGKETITLGTATTNASNASSDNVAQLHASVDVDAQQQIQALTQQIDELKRDFLAVSTQFDAMSAQINLMPKATTTEEVDGKLKDFSRQIVGVEKQIAASSEALVKEADAARQKLSSKFEKDIKDVIDLTGQLKADFNYAAEQLSAQTNAIAIRWSVAAATVSGLCVYAFIRLM